jgi:uncharacterized delta-60 repeat protein
MSLEKVEGFDFKVAALSVDGEGRIVVFGTATDPSRTYAVLAYNIGYVHPSYAAVLRFDPAGNPDPSFGANGIVRSDLGQPPYLAASVFPPPQPSGQDVLVNPVATVTGTVDRRGRPLLIAARFESVATLRSSFAFEGRLVARLDASGALDQGFGEGGVLTLPGSENRGIAPGAGGASALAWGYTQIRAFTASGGFDQGFGEDGLRARQREIADLAVDRSGRPLILQAASGRACRVVRLRADGSPDRGYGKGGAATPRLPRGRVACDSIALDRRGGAFVAGIPFSTGKGARRPPQPAVVFRLERSGRPDPSFGKSGRAWIRSGLDRGTELSEPRALLDPQGRLLVAASASSPATGPGVALFRYLLGD